MEAFEDYLQTLARVNGLVPGPKAPLEWLFYPGMLQESHSKWWADFGTRARATCHEGIDICLYRFGTGPICALPPGAKVPAMAKGSVLNISGDLLGSSLVVSCPDAPQKDGIPVMVYAHLDVHPELAIGDDIGAGSIIGQTFDTRTKKSKLLSHLHISCILLPKGLEKTQLNWTLFMDRNRVFHLNPVFLGSTGE